MDSPSRLRYRNKWSWFFRGPWPIVGNAMMPLPKFPVTCFKWCYFFLMGRRFCHVPLCWRASGYDQWSWDGCFCWQKVRSGKQASTNQTERSRKCASECLSMKKSHTLESTRQRLQTQRRLASPFRVSTPHPPYQTPYRMVPKMVLSVKFSPYIHHAFWVLLFFSGRKRPKRIN